MKSVVVTGGAKGIGRAISQAFAQKQYSVIIIDIDGDAAAATARRINNDNGTCEFFVADVSDEQAVKEIMGTMTDRDIRVVVNNAGISLATPLDGPTALWDQVIAVNLRGAYLIAKYATPLLGRGSSIINIASTRAVMSEEHWHAYAASKGGVVSLTHSLAISLGPKGIRVNAISPGWIDVTGWQKEGVQATPLRLEDLQQHPVGRVGKPEDVAAACLFLASVDAGFITGANLMVDGGMTVKMIYC